MQTGITTASFYPMPLEKAFAQIAEGGVCSAEIFVNTHCELYDPYLSEMLAVKREYGVDVVAVHPFSCAVETMMLFTDYERRVIDMLDYYKRFFEFMNQFGADYFILHGNKKENKIQNELYFERYMRLQEAAYSCGVSVLHENVSRCTAGSMTFLKEMADALGENAKFVLDTKQAHREGGDPLEFVKALDNHIKHVHFSDSGARGDCLKFGDGEYDNAALFKELKSVGFTGHIMLELYRQNYKDTEDLLQNYSLLKKAVENCR
ncbi:MAG: sugar phosphate isomerase/epimerase [Oscillospiraceae bacterium]|nr:sugar phosphate isomerase/epimerase [Oscillospiraceae bacterium]